jgi:hypothetical protein
MIMIEVKTVTFAGHALPVLPLPLGVVRRLLVVSNRLRESISSGTLTDATTEDMILIVSLGTGVSVAELDAMPGTMTELEGAMETVVQLAGLVSRKDAGGGKLGEAMAPATTQSAGLTTSTPT